MSAEIIVGTSGYSYDDWRGAFYPLRLAKEKMLAFYAREFSFTELNSTYYYIPPQRVFARLAERTPEGFIFTVKAHKSLTHERDENPKSSAEKFLLAVKPLCEAEKLGAVLFQFPYSFRKSEKSTDYLTRLREAFPQVPAAVEFRHVSWVEQSTYQLLRSLELAYVCVDEPRLYGLVGPVAVRTSSLGYVRFHGRNAAKWWKCKEPWERYDYLYDEKELAEWVPRAHNIARGANRVFIAFNNHPRAQAVCNARTFRNMIQASY
ncbi:MAG: DUF72 domain-containing protein [Bacillota bacterium]